MQLSDPKILVKMSKKKFAFPFLKGFKGYMLDFNTTDTNKKKLNAHMYQATRNSC